MSNSGKTYWSKKLEKKGFIRFGCDDLIEKKLEKELRQCGYSGIKDVAKWMGQPYEKKYLKNSQKYLEFEKQAMADSLLKIGNKFTNGENIVIDTTGSLIYIDEKIILRLKTLTKIVYLDTPDSIKEEMYRNFLKNPKPVIWGTIFKKIEDEKPFKALAKYYPILLAYRTRKYQKYADITADYFLLRRKSFTLINFLQLLRS